MERALMEDFEQNGWQERLLVRYERRWCGYFYGGFEGKPELAC
jgi:hypothetical protein